MNNSDNHSSPTKSKTQKSRPDCVITLEEVLALEAT